MVQKTTVTLIDDLDGGKAEETVRFGVDGDDLAIDLSVKNVKAFRKAIQPYVEASRRDEHSEKYVPFTKRRGTGGRVTAESRRRAQEIRAWAQREGIKTNPRGRVAQSIIDRYEAAMAT